MTRLEEYIGREILIKPVHPFRPTDRGELYRVSLHGIETGGIWIESDILTHSALEGLHLMRDLDPAKVEIPIYFLPYTQILYLVTFNTFLDSGTQESSEHS